MESINEEYKYALYALRLALLEIRAASDLNEARIYSDIFHNVPLMIAGGLDPESVRDEILEKAAFHGFEKTIASFFRVAEKNLA